MQGFHLFAIGKQFVAATRRLLVIERLIVGQRLARREDVNPSIHIYMDQTGQLEIPRNREDDGKGLPRYQRGRCDASRTIEDGRVTRKARAPHIEIRAHLAGHEKSHGVRLVRLECSGDSVSGVNPDFHWAERPEPEFLFRRSGCRQSRSTVPVPSVEGSEGLGARASGRWPQAESVRFCLFLGEVQSLSFWFS